MSLVQRYDAFDAIGVEQVIGVDPADQITRGQPKPFVDRVGLTTVPLVYNHVNSISILVNDSHGVVCRATVNKNVFNIGVCLCQYRFDRGPDKTALIERRRYDRYLRAMSIHV